MSTFHMCNWRRISQKRWVYVASILFASLLFMSTVHAAQCNLLASPTLVFDQYDPMSKTFQDIETSLMLACESVPLQSRENIAVRIQFLNRSGDGHEHVMINPANGEPLTFTLFKDRGRKIPLDMRSPIQVMEWVEGRKIFSIPIYGRIRANQNVSKGNYQLNLSLLITY